MSTNESNTSTHQPSPSASDVELAKILDTFRNLDDPQSRVFAGIMFGTSWEQEIEGSSDNEDPEGLSYFPIVLGVASPGSRIEASLADEVGISQHRISVNAHASGDWVAPFEGIEPVKKTFLIEIKILPEAWSGTVQARNFLITLPVGKILSHENVKSTAKGKLYGSIFAASESW